MRPQASPTKSIDDTGQEVPAPPLTEDDVAILYEIVTLANGKSEVSAHPRKVLFDAYHTKFEEHGRDTSQDKTCLRVLLSLAGPHVPGNTLMEKFHGIIQQAGFELEYDNDRLTTGPLPENGVGEQTMAESEAIVRALQQQYLARTKGKPAVAELENPTQEQPVRPRNSRSVPDSGRGSQQSGESHSNLAAMPYSVERPDPYAMSNTNNARATQTESTTDGQTEDVVFPEADQAAIQEFMLRMTAMEELAISKDSQQLKADSFRIWRKSTREKKATDFHRRKLLGRVMSQLASRQHDDYKADALHREILAKRSKETLEAWRAERRLRPTELRVSYQHDYKLAQHYMGSLRTLVRLPLHAEAVREQALKRKGFDTWGEELRVLAIKEKIDYRMMMSSIYRWLQVVRERALKRQFDQRRLRQGMHAMLTHYRAQHDRLRAAEARFTAIKKARQIIGAFVALSSKLDQLKRHELMADQFYHPKIEFENLLLWQDRTSHIQRMALRADDAREYFLSVKFLKIWKTRTKERKEHRLNQAYKHIRRRGKIRIVRAGLLAWRRETIRLHTLENMGQDFTAQRDHRLLRTQFVHWRNRTSQIAEIERQATTHSETHLLNSGFPPLLATAQIFAARRQRAHEFHAIHTLDIAARQLRKLNTRAFHLRRRERDADAMLIRHQRNHYRSMLRLWARKAGGEGVLGDPEGEADRIMNQSLLPDIEDEETAIPARLGTVTDTLKKRTPVPEYLHTPSNRAARVRKLAGTVGAGTVSTTPPSAPSSFAARLAAGGISMTPRERSMGMGRPSRLGFGGDENEDESMIG